MANPQPDPFLKLSKEYLDALKRIPLPPAERQILDTIMFRTWGNYPPRKEAVITNKDFMDENMIEHHQHVSRAIIGLLEKNMITRTGGNPRKPIYSIQKDYEKWKLGDKNPCKPSPFNLRHKIVTKKNSHKIVTDKKESSVTTDKKSFRHKNVTKPADSLENVALPVNNEKKPVENENSVRHEIVTKDEKTHYYINKEENVEFGKLDSPSLSDDEKNEPEKHGENKKTRKQSDGEIPFKEIIDYLNEKTNSKYKPESKITRKHIKARWNEDFRLDDFKIVIDVKSSQWADDPKMSSYLRPQTLFSGNFEGYLNEGLRLKKPDKPPQQDNKTEKFDISKLDGLL